MKNIKLKEKHDFGNVLLYIAAFFLPCIFLLNLYNNNFVSNHLIYGQVLILAGIFAVISVLLFIGLKFACKSVEGALLLIIFFWSIFWSFQVLLRIAARYSNSLTPIRFMILLGLGITFIAMCFRRYEPPFNKIKPVFITLSLGLCVMFVISVFPGISNEIILQRARAEMAETEYNIPYYIKQEFFIDPELPKPDIYWLHMDGMMSPGTVERFWGESQDLFRDELALRDFILYEDTELNAGFTGAALVALLSPAFYDSFYGERLDQTETELRGSRAEFLINELALVGLTYENDLMPNYELFTALAKAEYNLVLNRRGLSSYIPPSRDFTAIGSSNGIWDLSIFGDLIELVNLTTPLNILLRYAYSDEDSDDEGEEQQIDANDTSYLVFNFRAFHGTKMPRDPDSGNRDVTATHAYPSLYKRTSRGVIDFIDNILDNNPNAVIVIQGDHGFHLEGTQRFLLDQGYSLEQVLELMHSVVSAVRIPSQYGGLDMPMAPLNITRELVNRFVGENYQLLN